MINNRELIEFAREIVGKPCNMKDSQTYAIVMLADRLEMKLDAIESAQKKRILANQITDTEGRANALNDVCNDVIKLCGMENNNGKY